MSKRPSTDLFDLIKSLTKAEKRQFKLHGARHTIGEKNTYVELFDAIDRQSEYDEEALLQSNPHLKKKDVRSMKSYLYDLILRTLRSQTMNRSVSARVRYQIDKAEILIEKNLYSQASRLLARTKKTIQSKGLLVLELEVLLLESSLKVRMEKTNSLRRHQELHTQRMEVLSKLEVNAHYYDLFMQIHYFQLKVSSTHIASHYDELESIMQSKFLQNIELASTVFAELQFHEIHLRYCYLTEDPRAALEHTRNKIDLLHRHPSWLSSHLYEYVYTCGNLLVALVQFNLYDEFLEKLAGLKKLRSPDFPYPVDLDLNIYYAEIAFFLRQCQFQEAIQLIPEVEAFLDRSQSQIETSVLLSFHLAFAITLLEAGSIAEAIYWGERVLSFAGVEKYGRFADEARLISLIAYFEFGDTQVLESKIRGAYRKLREKKKLLAFEQMLLRFLRQLPNTMNSKELKKAFVSFRDELLQLQEGKDANAGIPQFDIAYWLESKIRKEPFSSVLYEHRVRKEHSTLEVVEVEVEREV